MSRETRGVRPRELRAVYEAAVEAGCTLAKTGGGHIKVTTPSGKVVFGATTGDGTGWRNLRGQLRRSGVPIG